MENKEARHYFYVLVCADHSFYAGYTTDPKRREAEHNKGIGSKYTKARRPVKMVYQCGFETRSLAMKAEAAFKKLTRTQKEGQLRNWKGEKAND
ncbi:GIY-YIG nuclease family protein [Jeotgalibaca dankookensis]|uniref:GIY-YIG nuclease family protein n=1 Tax=Jeotgalibaca dankookensis TaxID=708126 RepID=UPI00078575ED|nr:GIY-YIG nuclease family protein [Jeotgalibaca dankookensis]